MWPLQPAVHTQAANLQKHASDKVGDRRSLPRNAKVYFYLEGRVAGVACCQEHVKSLISQDSDGTTSLGLPPNLIVAALVSINMSIRVSL